MFEISWTTLPFVFCLCLITWALATVIFRSYFAEWVRFKLHNPSRYLRIQTLMYELNTKQRQTKDGPKQLTPDELKQNQQDLDMLHKIPWWERTLTYLFNCHFCQHCQAAILVCLYFGILWEIIPTVLLLGAGATWIGKHINTTVSRKNEPVVETGCKNCGSKK